MHKDASRESLALCFLLWGEVGLQVGGEKPTHQESGNERPRDREPWPVQALVLA